MTQKQWDLFKMFMILVLRGMVLMFSKQEEELEMWAQDVLKWNTQFEEID